MKSLILKDLYNIGHNIKRLPLILAILAVINNPKSGVVGYISTCVIICSMMVITTFSFDNISTWNKYAVIMPISRKDVVISKYIMLFIFSIFGMIAGFFISTVIGVFFRNFIIKEVMLESIVSLFISMFLGSIIIPLLYKYGVENARFLIIICFVIPFFLLSWILKGMNRFNIQVPTELNLKILFACLPILVIAFIILSINISYKIFKNQELN
ncbi:ABC transporter permease [Clostridium tetani]|uniref:ABC-2 transporter permease n=1 Tax=Clostridium tetani TaxID=1513 RepID=UPI000E143470|nr:ABC-2 transporter permease [Clostridium tetani]RXI51989.1 ABC-2 transporter permease [Clostridium tetani]RXI56686.1 ABC-2 transporter permease [Clostridium tetani]RXI76480.1 ABC-2 transporter permease [Clostridium tetani]RXM70655.1 ABC-2 transporter permease [Clostridium tetani]WFN61217.1 ABC-2 transporter permease [Clostridium tetani]